jgi:hypothetical protein
MRTLGWLFLISLLLNSSVHAANYADRVIAYSPGVDPGPLTNAPAVLGQPSRQTADPQWGTFPVDPFSPPYLPDQIVTLAGNGSLTVRLEQPVTDDPASPHGLDFLVFGNTFFQLNNDWTTTTGFLGGTNSGITRVSVSPDGTHYFTLDPDLAPNPDTWFPTDHAGSADLPVDPTLSALDFVGRDLEGIREVYQGSAGGAGYDLAWARDSDGDPVPLPYVRYLRFEQLHGEAQFDAFSAVSHAPAIFEDFATDPRDQGWRSHGEVSLFGWDPETESLLVTWDSSKTNSYFHRPLGMGLNRTDDFTVGFDLRLNHVAIGVDPGKPHTFQLAIGLINMESAIDPDLHRGAGVDADAGPRNLVEFAYFPDSGFGATIAPSIVSSNNQFASQFDFPIELETNTTFNVVLRYSANDQTLRTSLRSEHHAFATIQDVVLPDDFTDFLVDAVAVCSYSDAGQDSMFGGSILARGVIDNLFVQLPPPPVRHLTGTRDSGIYRATFDARAGWTYALERSSDLAQWDGMVTRKASESGPLTLEDPNPPTDAAFYRVHAAR